MCSMLNDVLWGNTVRQYLQSGAVFLAVVAAVILVQNLIVHRLRALAEKTKTDLDDFAVDILASIRSPEFYLLAFYVATKPLSMPAWEAKGFRAVVLIAITWRILRILHRCVEYGMNKAMPGGRVTEADRHARRNLVYVVNVVVSIVVLVFLLHNLGFHVESMIAGLGIGGVAVALAAQAVLGDLFSAVAIVLDKPFVIGDFIVVGDVMGSVEAIGIKNTRLRALSGELLVMPNSALTSAKIHNYRNMRERRVEFSLGLVYGTPLQQLKAVPGIVRGIIEAQEKTRFERAHFQQFGQSSLDFDIVYWVLDPDYTLFMDIQQKILLSIVEAFEKEGIDQAFPSQTVYLAKDAA